MAVLWLNSAFAELQAFYHTLDRNNLVFIQQAKDAIIQAITDLAAKPSLGQLLRASEPYYIYQFNIGMAQYTLCYGFAEQLYIIQFGHSDL